MIVCLSWYPFVDQSRALPDTNLQKLRVDRCKVGWLADKAKPEETWLWFACIGTGDSTGGRAHSHEMGLETDSHGYELVFWRGGRMICTITWPRSGEKLHGHVVEWRMICTVV